MTKKNMIHGQPKMNFILYQKYSDFLQNQIIQCHTVKKMV